MAQTMFATRTLYVLLLIINFDKKTSAEEWNSYDYEEEGDCSEGWTWNPENNFCYYVSEQYANFNVAEKTCRRMSATLSSITSFEEHFFILPLLHVQRQKCIYVDDCLNHWIGLRNVALSPSSPAKWTWSDESPYSTQTSMWGPSLPSGKYLCGSLHTIDRGSELNGFWKDAHCDRPMRYICKKWSS